MQLANTARARRASLRYRCLAWRWPALRGKVFTCGEQAHFTFAASGTWSAGDGVVIRNGFTAVIGGSVDLGEDAFFNNGCSLHISHSLTVGDGFLAGPGVSIVDGRYERTVLGDRRSPAPALPITIGKNVWIGAHAVVVAGASIGDGAVVGAGAVVTGHIPAGTVAVGVPARRHP